MKKIQLFLGLVLLISATSLQAQFAGGDGTAGNPYLVSNTTELNEVRNYPAANFLQSADITFLDSEFESGGAFYNAGELWEPIANFTGSYDGGFYEISNLKINRVTDNIGLFANTNGATIQKLGVKSGLITGNGNVGIMIGSAISSNVNQCYVKGAIVANADNLGGIIGIADNNTDVTESYSHSFMEGTNYVGGLIGHGGNVTNCWAAGDVTATDYMGGLIGANGNITQSLARASTISTGVNKGALIGSGGTVVNSFWSTHTTGLGNPGGGAVGLSTPDFSIIYTYLPYGWDFKDETDNGTNDYWTVNFTDNYGYPALAWEGYENVQYDLAIDTATIAEYPFTAAEVFTIDIKNNGLQPISEFSAKYKFNGGDYIIENSTVTINPGETYTYTFNQSCDMSTPQNYSFTFEVTSTVDEYSDNDIYTSDINTAGYDDLVLQKMNIGIGDYPYTNTEISVIFTNEGSRSQSNFDIILNIDGTDYTETYTNTINTGEIDTLTFSQTFDLSSGLNHDVSGTIDLSIDETPENNTLFEVFKTNQATIGNEENTGYSLPIEPYYGYSYSQSIYLPAEVQVTGTISKIAYYYSPDEGDEGLAESNQWQIYLGHTDKTEFANLDDWISESELTKVFDGTINDVTEAGWIYIDIDPFIYNGTQNLVINVREVNPPYGDSGDEFLCSQTSDGLSRSLTYYSDDNMFDPATPYSADYLYAYLPNTRFVIPLENDLAVTNLSTGFPPLTNEEQVTITIRNLGTEPQSNFDINMNIDGNTFTEQYTGTLAADEEVEYNFIQSFDFSASGVYEIIAEVVLATDEDLSNNTYSTSLNTVVNDNALSFDYNNEDNYVVIDDNDLLDPENITVETWVNPRSEYSYEPILFKSKPNDWDDGWGLYADDNGATVYIYFFVGDYTDYAYVEIDQNVWNHVAATYDGASIKIYLNGVLADEYVYAGGIIPTDWNLHLGGDGTTGYIFNGTIDETRIWSRVLTAEEIQANMFKQPYAENQPSDLVAYYKYNQGVAAGDNTGINTLTDFSANGFSGSLINFNLSEGNIVSNFVAQDFLFITEQPENQNICEYGDVEFTFDLTASGSETYQWQYSGDAGVSFQDLIDATDSTLLVTVDATNENYLYKCVITDGAFVAETDTVQAILNDIPIADAGSDDVTCGNEYMLTPGTLTGGESGYWSVFSGDVTIADTLVANATATANSYGEAAFIWTVNNDFCSDTDTVTINFVEIPVAEAGADEVVCGNEYMLMAGTLTGGETGEWTVFSGDATFDDTSMANATATANAYGEVVLVWEVSNDFCSDTDTVTINFIEEPIAEAGADDQICGNEYMLTAGELLTGETGQWSVFTGDATFDDASMANATATANAYGEVVLVWEVSNDFCSDTDTVTINFVEIPVADAGVDQDVTDNFTTLAATDPAPFSGMWSVESGGGAFDDNTLFNTSVTGLLPGDNVFVWTVDNSGCEDTDTVTVNYDNSNSISMLDESTISLYPNPTSNVLNIKKEGDSELTYRIMNINGKVILNNKFNGSMKEIDMSKLPAGIYSIIITMEDKTYTHKIIKQ